MKRKFVIIAGEIGGARGGSEAERRRGEARRKKVEAERQGYKFRH